LDLLRYFFYEIAEKDSTRVITDSTGTVVYSTLVDPYGGMQKQWVTASKRPYPTSARGDQSRNSFRAGSSRTGSKSANSRIRCQSLKPAFLAWRRYSTVLPTSPLAAKSRA